MAIKPHKRTKQMESDMSAPKLTKKEISSNKKASAKQRKGKK